jgi:hypothetical protein
MRLPNPPRGKVSWLGKRRSYDPMLSWWRRLIVSVMREQPIWRAVEAATGAEKKNQTWAPLPERDRSTAAGRPCARQVSAKTATSSVHDALSKSAARNQQVSSVRSG